MNIKSSQLLIVAAMINTSSMISAVPAPSFTDVLLPGIKETAAPFLVKVPIVGSYFKKYTYDREIDLSQLTTEQEPCPSGKKTKVYAAYKDGYDPESRLAHAKKLRNWHLGVAAALHFVANPLIERLMGPEYVARMHDKDNQPSSYPFCIQDSSGTDHISVPAVLNSLKMIHAWAAFSKGMDASDLGSKIKAAEEGDGDMARRLTRKKIAMNIEPVSKDQSQ